ncbi:UPF0603 protein At1g54780, chloroplastic [Prosopis cineraria]|uniref:UPF0603 protein At1g54780, chloroplastic n=1 Tax=Prosopis cineraria TaxID=364024 RepID=UPI00240EF70C|nr:UPF0603 protein At1g54780, chloroplastic [Prosopis cineraria]
METIFPPHSLSSSKFKASSSKILSSSPSTRPKLNSLFCIKPFPSSHRKLQTLSLKLSLPNCTSRLIQAQQGLAALAISLALNFSPLLHSDNALASEFDVLNEGPPKDSYIFDDAGLLSRVKRSDLEARKNFGINFVTVRKLTSKADAFEYADQVLERWYPTVEEGNNKGIVVLVTGQKEGAVTGGPAFVQAVGEKGLDAAVSENLPAEALPSKSLLSSIENTKSWFQFYGDGFAIRVPPEFQDINEPEDYNAGLSLYGDKAKPKTFAARFASPDGYEVLSVITRPTNQLKITFLEAQDITDLGSLKNAARIFVPGGATLFSARTIKIKEEDGFRTYYFYEFGRDDEHVALMAGVSGGKAIIAGATAPQSKWDGDGVKLRSAAISLTIL